ncbi:MAG: peroxiredoxin [Patescibacteria group bacterium]|jgi:peroxiredoxin Q/BCP
MKLTESAQAPNFSAQDQDGHTHTLNNYSGKWLLLYFYPRDFTPGCTTEACSLRDNFSELQKLATVVGVSTDSVDSHKKFSEKYRLPFTLLADDDKKMTQEYGADGLIFNKRTSFLIGPDGMIKKIYEKVKPERHAAEIIADLKALR